MITTFTNTLPTGLAAQPVSPVVAGFLIHARANTEMWINSQHLFWSTPELKFSVVQAISARYRPNNISITFLCTQGFANCNIKNTMYGCYLFQYSNHGHLTLVHIFSNTYFVTCSTPPKLKDSEHDRYFWSPPARSSTAWTTSQPLEIRLKLHLMQRVCMVH